MKIICTKQEFELLNAGGDLCTTLRCDGKCKHSDIYHCDECYKENIEWEIINEYQKGACKNRSSDKWYDHVENSLLKARHGKHVLYDVDYLLDHLAHEVSIMEQVRQMRDKEI